MFEFVKNNNDLEGDNRIVNKDGAIVIVSKSVNELGRLGNGATFEISEFDELYKKIDPYKK